MRVLICDQFGGFGLSRPAFLRLREMGCEAALSEPDVGEKWGDGSSRTGGSMTSFGREIPRDDLMLLAVFDELGQGAAGFCCHLKAVEVPDGVEWVIEEYDGFECVAEAHRAWS